MCVCTTASIAPFAPTLFIFLLASRQFGRMAGAYRGKRCCPAPSHRRFARWRFSGVLNLIFSRKRSQARQNMAKASALSGLWTAGRGGTSSSSSELQLHMCACANLQRQTSTKCSIRCCKRDLGHCKRDNYCNRPMSRTHVPTKGTKQYHTSS